MQQWLMNPAVQSGIIPFVVALIIAFAGGRIAWRWGNIGLIVAFLTSVYLAVGFQLFPLTSSRKIVFISLVAFVLGFIIEFLPKPKNLLISAMAVLSAAVTIWLIWPVISYEGFKSMGLLAAYAAVFVAWIVASTEFTVNRPNRTFVILFALGMGVGVSALLGASAKFGQYAGSIGAAAAAYVLLSLFISGMTAHRHLSFAGSLVVALIAVASCTYASLPWHVLLPIALIPLAVYVPNPFSNSSGAKATILTAIYAMVPAVVAMGITWRNVGPPPM